MPDDWGELKNKENSCGQHGCEVDHHADSIQTRAKIVPETELKGVIIFEGPIVIMYIGQAGKRKGKHGTSKDNPYMPARSFR